MFFITFTDAELCKEQVHQILIKIYESGLMNKSHDTITRANLKNVLTNLQKESNFARSLTVSIFEKILWDTHYLMPIVAESDVLRFNTKNFHKVIQDDKRKYKFI